MGSPRKDRHIFGYEKVNSDPLCGNDLRLLQSSKKKKLVLGKAARKFCLPWADNFSGPLPIEQVAMKSYLPGRKKLLVPKDWTVLFSSSDF